MIKKLVFIFLFLALILRVLFLIFHPGDNYFLNKIYTEDGIRYDGIAKNLIEGKGYTFNGVPTARTSPLYPLFLALIYSIFGHNVVIVRIIQILLGVISSYLIYRITKEIFDSEKIALISLFLSATYYPFIQLPCYVITESLFIVTFLLSLLFLVKILKFQKKNYYFLSGIFIGLSILTRPVGIVILISAVIFLLFRNFNKNIILLLLSFLMVTAPWMYRNYRVFNAFILLSTNGGLNLYRGNNPNSTGGTGGWYLQGKDTGPLPSTEGMNELEADKFFKRKALEFIKRNKKRYLYLCWKRFLNMWRPFYSGSNLLNKIIMIIWDLLIIYPLSILGVILAWKKEKSLREIFLFLLLLFVLYNSIFIISISVIRYRYPIMPILIIFASYLICNYGTLCKKMGENWKTSI